MYIVGGGDYQKDEESLYNCWELDPVNNYQMTKRDSMKHPRHGHSVTWLGEKFVVVTGSRKEKNDSQRKSECYNSDIDLWFELPDMNVGRHYHSSCSFQDRFVYIFCGIANKTRKYINSIEVLDNNKSKKQWIQIPEIQSRVFPDRQGCGVCQKDEHHILIFGGFSGRFLKDSYLFNTQSNAMTRTASVNTETFVFQMPVMWDSRDQSVISCDIQHQVVTKFDARN